MKELEIVIIEDNGDVIGSLDLSKPSDFPLALTKSIANIKNIEQRNTDYSLDFNIPNTQNNNSLLMSVKQINATTKLLDKKRCVIKTSGNIMLRGFIRFSLSTFEGEYKATFFGGNADWVELLSEVDINSLDWQNLNEIAAGSEEFTPTRVAEIQAGTSDNYDITYPYLDRNAGAAFDSFRPVIYMRKFVQRAFEKIGYTVESDFLDSEFVKGDNGDFKGLVLDPAFQFNVDQNTIDQTAANYTTDRITAGQDPNTWNLDYVLGNYGAGLERTVSKFSNFFNILNQDNTALFDPLTSVYTVSQSGEYTIRLDVKNYVYATFYNLSSWQTYNPKISVTQLPPSVKLNIVKNNVSTTVIDGTILKTVQLYGFGSPKDSIVFTDLLQAGDNISFWFTIADDANGFQNIPPDFTYLNAPSLDQWRWSPGNGATISIQRKSTVKNGDTYTLNSHLPSNVSCLGILQDLKVLHNLYFLPDPKRLTIKIEPRNEFYQDLDQAEDITEYIDLNTKPTIDYLTDYKRNLVFRYANDDKDGFLNKWNTINLRTYAEYRHAMSNRFEKGDTVFELKHIAPTITGKIDTENIITSHILQHWDDAENAQLPINEEYKMRYFQVIRNQQFNKDGSPRRTVNPLIITTALMEGYGNVSTYNNAQLTFNGPNGLFKRHYAKTATNIENLAVLNLKRLMTDDQFRNLDFTKPVYISSPAEIAGYYIYESVDNFDGVEEKPVACKLLKWRAWADATIDLTQGTNITEDTQDPQGDPAGLALLYIYNENDPNTPTLITEVINNNGVKIYNT